MRVMETQSNDLAANGAVSTLDVRGYGSATLHLKGGAVAAAGATVILEASNVENPTASDWFTILGAPTSSQTGATASPLNAAALAANTAHTTGYRINAAGITFIRARVTALTSGSVLARWVRSHAPVESTPNAPSPATTVTANPPAGTAHAIVGTASTNRSVQVATACNLDELTISNPTAATVYVKLYNKATAPVSTDTPLMTVPVLAGDYEQVPFPNSGKRFAAGLGVAITAAMASADDTAVAAGVLVSFTRR